MDLTNIDSTLVTYLSYNHDRNEGFTEYLAALETLKERQPQMNIRLSFKLGSIPSALSVYESVYTFCPKSSIVVSSTYNYELTGKMAKTIMEKVNDNEHYYSIHGNGLEGLRSSTKRFNK